MNALKEPLFSLDTQVILLLCGQFGKKPEKADMTPLTYSEYAWLAHWLQAQHLHPAELLETSIALKLKHLEGHETITPSRLLTLLMRKPAMTKVVENWTRKGVWIISEHDQAYPYGLKSRLGQWAPPLFYGIGHSPLLQKGGIALVGPHDLDKQNIELTKKLAKLSVQQNMIVISHGTRGIETEALLTALAQGRCAVGVLSDHLIRMSNKYRHALQEERLVLVSPFGPETIVSNSLIHHRCLYGLADVITIMKNLHEEEEAWAVAMENLKMKWVPLFIRQDEPISLGNQKLLEQGAIPIDKAIFHSSTSLRTLLLGNQQGTKNEVTLQSHASFAKSSMFQNTVKEESLEPPKLMIVTSQPPEIEESIDLFYVVWPHIERQLSCERTEEELVEHLNLHPKQLKIWLQRALDLGQVIKLHKPTRYVSVSCYQSKYPSLF